MIDPKDRKESYVEDYLVEQVEADGGEIRKVKWPGRRGPPDRFVLHHGGRVWVELKRLGEKPEPHQVREHERLRRFGEWVEVLDSREAVGVLMAVLRHRAKTRGFDA